MPDCCILRAEERPVEKKVASEIVDRKLEQKSKGRVSMKRKGLKIAALIAALLLIAGLGWFANELVGNPISKMLATKTAENYLSGNYGETDFYIERISYSFKDCNYYVYIESPSSVDSSFTICIDRGGRLKWDSYENRVLNRQNTADRLSSEYRALVKSVLDSPEFPFGHDIGYGDLQIIPREYIGMEGVVEYVIPAEELELDGQYDVHQLGARVGQLVLYVQDETVTVERAAEIMLEMKRILDEAGVPFYAAHFVLQYPKGDDGNWPEGRVEALGFLSTDIYEEGMVERMRAADEAAKAYYASEDAKNAELMEKLTQ